MSHIVASPSLRPCSPAAFRLTAVFMGVARSAVCWSA